MASEELKARLEEVLRWLPNYVADLGAKVAEIEADLRIIRDCGDQKTEQVARMLADCAESSGSIKAWTESNLAAAREVMIQALKETLEGGSDARNR